jgi:GNAT superfamily N-acetyltransferase
MRMSGARTGPSPEILTVSGDALLPYVPALARLRIAVFRDWPYLYDGDPAYEERYLRSYVDSPRAGVVLAIAGDEVVGASTCLPLTDETANIQAPFLAQGIDPGRSFYFGESILLHPWRGHGLGRRFFTEREAHTRRVSACDIAAFCAVERPADHPARPVGYVPLDSFWRNRGFARAPGMACTMSWREVGATVETPHRLNFWWKSLTGAPLS